MRRTRLVAPLFLVFLACAPQAPAGWRLLVFSETAGFRHDSIDEGRDLLTTLGNDNGFVTTASEDSTIFSLQGLAPFSAVVFLNTTGDILTASQEAVLDCFVHSGGGWIGVHSAADTEQGWPGYGEILGGGAWILNHPAIQTATLVRESSNHPSTAHFPDEFPWTDEWYNFVANPAPAVDVLLRIDESSYEPGPGAMGSEHPVTWSHAVGGGRSWYTNLGHRAETYDEPDFAAHLLGGVLWSARCTASPCPEGQIFRDGFEAASTCRWPVAALGAHPESPADDAR